MLIMMSSLTRMCPTMSFLHTLPLKACRGAAGTSKSEGAQAQMGWDPQSTQ